MRGVAVVFALLALVAIAAALVWAWNRWLTSPARPSGEWKPRFQDGRVEVIGQGETPILIDTIEGFGALSQDRLNTALVNAQDEADARNYALRQTGELEA